MNLSLKHYGDRNLSNTNSHEYKMRNFLVARKKIKELSGTHSRGNRTHGLMQKMRSIRGEDEKESEGENKMK